MLHSTQYLLEEQHLRQGQFQSASTAVFAGNVAGSLQMDIGGKVKIKVALTE